MLTDCDDESYYVIKWMACLFDICKKKDTSSCHAPVQAQQEKKTANKKNQGQKREIRSTAPLRSNGISFDYDYILLVSS